MISGKWLLGTGAALWCDHTWSTSWLRWRFYVRRESSSSVFLFPFERTRVAICNYVLRSIYTERKRTRKWIFTVRNSSCGKVMFSQVSVCPQGGGVHHPPCQTDTPPADTHPLGRHPPPPEMVTAADSTHPTGMHSCFLWFLSLLSVNIKSNSLWTHLEAMSLSLSLSQQYKRILKGKVANNRSFLHESDLTH